MWQVVLEYMGADWCLKKATSDNIIDRMTGLFYIILLNPPKM
jgi:hypothetical protein